MNGKVKWWNDSKGFGFILGEDGNDYFGHFSELKMDGYKTLNEDEGVVFTPITRKINQRELLEAKDIIPCSTLADKSKRVLVKLLELEWSMDTPIAKRKGKKACPWCAEYHNHDKECKLNQAIHALMSARTRELPESIQLGKEAISEVYRLTIETLEKQKVF